MSTSTTYREELQLPTGILSYEELGQQKKVHWEPVGHSTLRPLTISWFKVKTDECLEHPLHHWSRLFTLKPPGIKEVGWASKWLLEVEAINQETPQPLAVYFEAGEEVGPAESLAYRVMCRLLGKRGHHYQVLANEEVIDTFVLLYPNSLKTSFAERYQMSWEAFDDLFCQLGAQCWEQMSALPDCGLLSRVTFERHEFCPLLRTQLSAMWGQQLPDCGNLLNVEIETLGLDERQLLMGFINGLPFDFLIQKYLHDLSVSFAS